MATTHITPALSYGDEPDYPFVHGGNLEPAAINELIEAGRSVHVESFEQAQDVLRGAGLTDEQIAHQLAVADGSWAQSVLDKSLAGRATTAGPDAYAAHRA